MAYCGDGNCDPDEDACDCPADCGPAPGTEIPEQTCTDNRDNDCDGNRDCADADCATDPACSVYCGNAVCEGPYEDPCNCPTDCGTQQPTEVVNLTCADGIDNDCDGDADCLDADCAADPNCQADCGNGTCEWPMENPCNCTVDCGTPPANEVPNGTCTDGIDNDCDSLPDCEDTDCATDPVCDADCGNGVCEWPLENPCNCVDDCGNPPSNEFVRLTCRDGYDNDCDGVEDCADGDCDADPSCQGAPIALRPMPVEWTSVDGTVGGSCTVDADCGPGTEGYCVPAPGGALPGSCYGPAHRYLSIARHPDQVGNTARRVCLATECLGWVGEPFENGGLMLAHVVSAPVFAGSDFAGNWPDEVNVTGCKIATAQVYYVDAIQLGQNLALEDNYSEAVELRTTTTWGDVVSTCFNNNCLPPQGQVGVDDILALIARFQGINNAPLVWLDLDPSTGVDLPNQQINIGDILSAIAGFQGEGYPGCGPLDCDNCS